MQGKRRVFYKFDNNSLTSLLDSLDAEIIDLSDGRRIILPKLQGVTECTPEQRASVYGWRCQKCSTMNNDIRLVCLVCLLCGTPK